MKALDFNTAKAVVVRTAGRSGLVLRKYSPEILMVVGIAGMVTSGIMACKATLRVEEVVIDELEEEKLLIKKGAQNLSKEKYTENDYKKDMTLVYYQACVRFIKLYGPSITLGAASVGCVLGAHNIMQRRNIALVAAYKLVEQGFTDYRKRVVDELGADKDKQFKYGIQKETVTAIEEDEDGKKKKTKAVIEKIDPNMNSQYARFFDESSRNWSKTPEYNLVFLRCQQNYANDLLKARGHVFLNEVYDLVGIPRTQAGAVVGWVMSKDGDNYVDFGMYDTNKVRARDFVNGYERSILLDFNVDGVIYDLI